MSDTSVTNEPPQGNQPEARTPTGELKDLSPSGTPTPTPEKEPEGQSFLTQKPEEKPKEGEAPAPKEGEVKPPEGEEKPEPQAGAPEKYEDFKLPEGYTLDPTAAKDITGLFKELNLTQEQGQKLVDYYTKNSLETAEAPYKLWAQTQKEWVSDIKDRFGSKAEAVRTEINSAITNALPPSLARAFRTAMDITGAGSNPDIFEALSILAKPHLEGRPVVPGKVVGEANKPPGAREQVSLADAMYPHLAANRGAQ